MYSWQKKRAYVKLMLVLIICMSIGCSVLCQWFADGWE